MTSDEKHIAPLYHFPCSGDVKAHILILPGMAVPARFFSKLARSLTKQGFEAWTMDWRGHGESIVRASSTVDFGYKDHAVDASAALAQIKASNPAVPIYLLCHSLGGQIALMMTVLSETKFNGIILSGSGTPHAKPFVWWMRPLIHILSGIISVSTKMFGYFPGHRIGFAGREGKTEMMDWIRLKTHNDFCFSSVGEGFQQQLSAYSGDVLVLSYDKDLLAPRPATKMLLQNVPNANVTYVGITSEELGMRANHFNWAKRPEKVIAAIDKWRKR